MKTLVLLLGALCAFHTVAADVCSVTQTATVDHIDMVGATSSQTGSATFIVSRNTTGTIDVLITVSEVDVRYAVDSHGIHQGWNVRTFLNGSRTGSFDLSDPHNITRQLNGINSGDEVKITMTTQNNHMGNLEDGEHEVNITLDVTCS